MLKKIRTVIFLFVAICIFGVFLVGCNYGNGEVKPPDIQLPEPQPPDIQLPEPQPPDIQLPEPQNCEAILETTLYHPINGYKDFIAICSSLDEFKKICLKNGYDFFDGSNIDKNHYDTDAGKIIRGYTDKYFEDNAFIVCAFYRSAWTGQYRIEGVNVSTEKLTLYIKYPRSETANDVINNVFLIAGVKRSLVAGITDVDYVLR